MFIYPVPSGGHRPVNKSSAHHSILERKVCREKAKTESITFTFIAIVITYSMHFQNYMYIQSIKFRSKSAVAKLQFKILDPIYFLFVIPCSYLALPFFCLQHAALPLLYIHSKGIIIIWSEWIIKRRGLQFQIESSFPLNDDEMYRKPPVIGIVIFLTDCFHPIVQGHLRHVGYIDWVTYEGGCIINMQSEQGSPWTRSSVHLILSAAVKWLASIYFSPYILLLWTDHLRVGAYNSTSAAIEQLSEMDYWKGRRRRAIS